MRSSNYSVPVIILIVAAIFVFGAFVLVNVNRPAPGSPFQAETEQVTAEQTAATLATDATPEMTADAEQAAGTDEATAESTAAADGAPATEAAGDPADTEVAAGEGATPTSISRVRDSILIGTQVTPVLQSTPEQAAQPASEGEAIPTPTSVSRVENSILIGTQVTPALQSTPQTDGETPADSSGGSEAGATPTSVSRVENSILMGTQVTPVLQSTPQADDEAAPDSGGESEDGATPTSMSRMENSITLSGDAADSVSGAASTEEASEPLTSTEEATAEATEQANEGQAGVSSANMPTPVLGRPHDAPSALQPRGPVAHRQADLWWIMLALSAVIYVGVLGLVMFTLLRRRRAQTADSVIPGEGRWFIYGGGIAMPAAVLTLLFALTLATMVVLAAENQPTEMTIEIIGRQWWWEVRYPDHDVVTANEIHIPVGQPVRFVLNSADVIHSFWVPELGGKMDLIPGRTNTFWLQADEPGEYRGQCAEFCGIQHANMAFLVIAGDTQTFVDWLEQQRQPAKEPSGELAMRGQEVFLNSQCIGCHTVRGTNASGVQGPDLTHFGSRRTIGAATLPNTTGHLGGWIVDSQGIKPGNLMPPQDIAGQDLHAVIAYLQSLQ